MVDAVLSSVRSNHSSLLAGLQEELAQASAKIHEWQDRFRQEEKRRHHCEALAEKAMSEIGQIRAAAELQQHEANLNVKKMYEQLRDLQLKLDASERARQTAEDHQKVAERMLSTFQSRALGPLQSSNAKGMSDAMFSSMATDHHGVPFRDSSPRRNSAVSARGRIFGSPSVSELNQRDIRGVAEALGHSVGSMSGRGMHNTSMPSPRTSLGMSSSSVDLSRHEQEASKLRMKALEAQGKVSHESEVEKLRADQAAAQERIKALEQKSREAEGMRQQDEYQALESNGLAARRKAELAQMQVRAEAEAGNLQRMRLTLQIERQRTGHGMSSGSSYAGSAHASPRGFSTSYSG